MKNNAGIKISNSETLIKYAKHYMEAFDKSTAFFDWVYGGIIIRIFLCHIIL